MVGFPWLAASKRVAMYALLFVALIMLVTEEPPNAFVCGNVALALLLLEVCVVLHEGAHAVSAALLGFTVRRLVVGQGPLLFRRRFGRTDLVVRALPFTGLTLQVPGPLRWYRLRRWLLVAAGPALNIALAWWCLGDRDFVDLAQRTTDGIHPLDAFAWVNAFMAYAALLPLPSGLGFPSDGVVLLTLPFDKKPVVEPRVLDIMFDVEEAWEAHDHDRVRELSRQALAIGSEHDTAFRLTLLEMDAECGQLEQALEGMQAMLRDLPKESPCRALLQNDIAWYSLEVGRAELLPSALALSKEALAKLKTAPWAKGTHGAALVASGELARGRQLLRSAIDFNESSRSRAHNAAWLAVAAARASSPAAAKGWLRLACALDPRSRSIARAQSALETA